MPVRKGHSMTIEEIDAFLAVAESGTLSAAAQKLFLSQSTVSQRIKRLEQELRVPLFQRQQGQRSVALTSHGHQLAPLAQQWSSLWRDMSAISQSPARSPLTIGSVDIINNVFFVPFYQSLITWHSEFELTVNTHHSDEIHGLLEKRIIDIGFVLTNSRYPEIISTPIYREPMCLIAHPDSGYRDGLPLSALPAGREIYLRWSPEHEAWHRSHASGRLHLVNVDTGTLASHYLSIPGSWLIGPKSLLSYIQKWCPAAGYRLSETPPDLVCYQLTHRYPRPSKEKLLEHFQELLKSYLETSSVNSSTS